MPTYYYFTCRKCRTRGGVFGEQSWGWGSFDIIESFKFLAYHTRTCGEDSIRVISENVDNYVDQLHTEYNEFLEETKHLFPHSGDWAFFDRWKELSVDELKEKWVEENRIRHADERVKFTGILKQCEMVQGRADLPHFHGQVVKADGQPLAVLGNARQLPEANRSYIIIGVKRDHPELGEVVEVHKMIPESESSRRKGQSFMNIDRIGQILDKVREGNPLIHNITNVVVTNFTANGLLALGASPVMAYAKQEVADMARIAGALVLNMGTLDEGVVEAMRIAGKSANDHDVPVLFDPVGAGATPYRTEVAQAIVKEVATAIVRGNAAEIANVIGEHWQIKGVDAGEGNGDAVDLAKRAAKSLGTIVAITGKVDVISDGERTFLIRNGHPILTKVTGTGCLLTSVMGAFAAVEGDRLFAGAAALVCYGVAAEQAAKKTAKIGPGSFQMEFLNELAGLTADDVRKYGVLEAAD